MKKILAIMLIASMSVGTLAGCGSKPADDTKAESKATSTEAKKEEPKKEEPKKEGPVDEKKTSDKDISVASWNNAANNLKEIAVEFNKKGGDGKVVINYWDGDYTKLKPALQAGNGVPDIFQTQNRDAQSFYNSYGTDKFMDLSDLIEPDKANWPEYVLDMCKSDGKYYSMPWDIGPCGLFYRTDIYDAAGIKVEDLTTWDKYIEAGKKLKATNPDATIAEISYNGTGWDLVMMLLNQQGGQYLKDGKANFNNPEMVKTFETILKMKDAGVLLDIPAGWDDRIKGINDNKLVSFGYAAWYMGTMQDGCKATAGKWKVAPLPAFEEGGKNTAGIGGSVLSVSADTKNEKLCKDFLTFSMKEPQGNDINMKFGEFPSYKTAYETEFFKSPNEYYGGQVTGTAFAALSDSPTTEFGPYFTDVGESMKQVVGKILTENADIAKTLDEGTADAQNKLDAKG